jgi:tetratricopeptide (TPR) repeat protein
MSSQANVKSTRKASDAVRWAKARKRNAKSPTGSSAENAAIEDLLARERWAEARARIFEALVNSPDDHWLWTHLGLTYYEEKKYPEALKCTAWAMRLAPRCPLVLWHYAGTLSMCNKGDLALAIWTLLLSMDLDEVAYGDHGEGMDWALRLLNDVHYRMGRYFQFLGEHRLAARSLEKYLHNRSHGVESTYSEDQARKYLDEALQFSSSTA